MFAHKQTGPQFITYQSVLCQSSIPSYIHLLVLNISRVMSFQHFPIFPAGLTPKTVAFRPVL